MSVSKTGRLGFTNSCLGMPILRSFPPRVPSGSSSRSVLWRVVTPVTWRFPTTLVGQPNKCLFLIHTAWHSLAGISSDRGGGMSCSRAILTPAEEQERMLHRWRSTQHSTDNPGSERGHSLPRGFEARLSVEGKGADCGSRVMLGV